MNSNQRAATVWGVGVGVSVLAGLLTFTFVGIVPAIIVAAVGIAITLTALFIGRQDQADTSDNSTGSTQDDPPDDNQDGSESGDGLGDDGEETDGADDGSGCFVAGTPVLTGSSWTAIERMDVGREVTSYDLESQQAASDTVVKVYRVEGSTILTLDFGAEQIRCTPRHRFYTGDWTAASGLRPGDRVLRSDGQWQRLESVESAASGQPVFNLRVRDRHNYFVGSLGLLVHNEKMSETSGDDGVETDDARALRKKQRKPGKS